MSLENAILTEARQLGFIATGIATAGPAENLDLFNKWLRDGNSADMAFMERSQHVRTDVRNVMPEVRSIIVAAARYATNKEPGKGFSTYARGMDYHIVIRNKLSLLSDFIKKQPGISTRICVDSVPLFEREWAVRAGIGWRGKQGQIVNPAAGCCLSIGVLLLNIELAPSLPCTNQCGNCRLCMDACPTGAILDDGLIDCRRCIAYLTIEHKGDIPQEFHKTIGKSLFGCDICTAVCPWNVQDNDGIISEFKERQMPNAEEILAMSKEEFTSRFKDSTVFRTGLERLKRNAALVQGNT